MIKYRRGLLFIGLFLCGVSIVLLLITLLFPQTYFIIALSNLIALPSLWGIFVIMFWFLLREVDKKGSKLKQAIYVLLLIVLVSNIIRSPLTMYIKDIHAVIVDELYIVEGVVTDTRIRKVSSSSLRHRSPGTGYYLQVFTLNHINKDEFSIRVEDRNDYVLQVGKSYRITATPHVKTVLNYEELHVY